MPLSEHEQRLLEQIERALYAEDPKFASTVRGGKLRRPSRRRRVQGIVLFVLGIVMLVLVFSVLNVLWIAAVAGASPTTALIVAVLIGGVITFNVKRYLEARYREKFPG